MEEFNVEYDPTGFTSSAEVEKRLEEESIKQDKLNEAQQLAVQKEEQSKRVKDFMNNQIMDQMKEYEPE